MQCVVTKHPDPPSQCTTLGLLSYSGNIAALCRTDEKTECNTTVSWDYPLIHEFFLGAKIETERNRMLDGNKKVPLDTTEGIPDN